MPEEEVFVPATRAISIGNGVVYRPIRSWHSGVYAGERRTIVSGDASGCIMQHPSGLDVTMVPRSYTHRLYWNVADPSKTISAFLSYPDAMGYSHGTYFWEVYLGEVERFLTEEECEAAIINAIGSILQ